MVMEDFEKLMKDRPHVVLLGAGASIATIPNGDKNGKRISAMDGFIEKLDLTEIIKNVKLDTKSTNLEDIYSEMHSKTEYVNECQQLEDRIFKDFLKYEIPDEPTIYDHLVLGLTKKDLIATFNWDPLLMQAYARSFEMTDDLPELAFLHGNVAVKICENCKLITNSVFCLNCGSLDMDFSKLLFPVKNKNYRENAFIRNAWATLEEYLSKAYMVTVFGYSAPKTDKEAIDIMKHIWGKVSDRTLEQLAFIDIRKEDEIVQSWNEFIHTHHYDYHTSFYDSRIAKFPRRSCEKTFDQYMNNKWLSVENPFVSGQSFAEIKKIIDSIK